MEPKFQLSIFRCKWCGKVLHQPTAARQMRSDKLYCGRSCRASHSQWAKRSEKITSRVCKLMHELAAYLDDQSTSEAAIQDFSAILRAWRFETRNRGIYIKAANDE